MPSRTEHRCRRGAGLAAVAAVCLFVCARSALAVADDAPLSEAQVKTAVDHLKADPNLATERSMRMLRWKKGADAKKPQPESGWEWGMELLGWVGETSRLIVWLAVGLLTALLVVFVIRFIRAAGPAASVRKFEAPTHVRDLDIRPESLPDDVGAEALALWQRGEHRAALSLLYRGLLSRLVHVHEVPILKSTTEGDCIELAASRLHNEAGAYVARLVQVWQQAVYGNREPLAETVRELCAGFDAALTPTAPASGVTAP